MAWYDGALAPPNSPTEGPWDPGYLAWLRQQQGAVGTPGGVVPPPAAGPVTTPGYDPGAPPAVPAPTPHDALARPWYAFAGGGNQHDWAQAGLGTPGLATDRGLPQEQQLFYDVNPELVNRAVETYANADPLSHYRQYVQAQMPGWQQDYARQTALPGHAADTYTDYVGQRYNQLAQGFGGLSASQRGENPLAFGGGEGTAPGRLVYR